MEIGRHNKLPNYSVIGEKNNFYLWVNEDGKGSSCNWIKGHIAFQLFNELSVKFKKDKTGFINLLKKHHKINGESKSQIQQQDRKVEGIL